MPEYKFQKIFKNVEVNLLKLSEIAEIKKGIQLNKIDMINSGDFPVVNGGITYSGYTDSFNREENTITISEGGNSCGFVNYITKPFWAGGHCYTLNIKNKDVYSKYLFWFLKSKENEIMKLRVGSGLPNIQSKDIESFEVGICKKDKQQQIAEILDLQQHELTLLTQELSQYKLQKQGLMQKLLTGEWRIK